MPARTTKSSKITASRKALQATARKPIRHKSATGLASKTKRGTSTYGRSLGTRQGQMTRQEAGRLGAAIRWGYLTEKPQLSSRKSQASKRIGSPARFGKQQDAKDLRNSLKKYPGFISRGDTRRNTAESRWDYDDAKARYAVRQGQNRLNKTEIAKRNSKGQWASGKEYDADNGRNYNGHSRWNHAEGRNHTKADSKRLGRYNESDYEIAYDSPYSWDFTHRY